MPILETKIFGSIIEINYSKNEDKDKLIKLVEKYKERLKEYKNFKGKVMDTKILFLAALKAEDEVYDLKINSNTKINYDEKIKEIINLKDQISFLKKENTKLKAINSDANIEIDQINKKISSLIERIIANNEETN